MEGIFPTPYSNMIVPSVVLYSLTCPGFKTAIPPKLYKVGVNSSTPSPVIEHRISPRNMISLTTALYLPEYPAVPTAVLQKNIHQKKRAAKPFSLMRRQFCL